MMVNELQALDVYFKNMLLFTQFKQQSNAGIDWPWYLKVLEV